MAPKGPKKGRRAPETPGGQPARLDCDCHQAGHVMPLDSWPAWCRKAVFWREFMATLLASSKDSMRSLALNRSAKQRNLALISRSRIAQNGATCRARPSTPACHRGSSWACLLHLPGPANAIPMPGLEAPTGRKGHVRRARNSLAVSPFGDQDARPYTSALTNAPINAWDVTNDISGMAWSLSSCKEEDHDSYF